MPQTPVSAFPQTPVPQTPGAAAAQGWMEDIKRVISFDSVEEFWGYAQLSTIRFFNFTDPDFSLYNNIIPPSQLPQKANYYLFKVRFQSHRISCLLTGHPRRGLFPHGKTRRTRMGGNGAFNCLKTKIVPTLTRCGCIP